jgi:hypothetical protein
MGKTLILKPLLRSPNSISFMLIIFTFQLIQTIRILWFCHRSGPGNSKNTANQAQFIAPRILCPITFKNTQGVHEAPMQATTHITMVNDVTNQDTGVILEYHQLIQDETTFPVWNKAAANEFGQLAQVWGGGGLKYPIQSSSSHSKHYPKGKL